MNIHVMYCPFSVDDKYDAFHYEMFHGDLKWKASGGVVRPLTITRNCRVVPDVTCPLNSLVVSERAKERLEGLPGVEFREVVFEKLVDHDWRLGDFSHYDEDSIFRPTPLDDDPGDVVEHPLRRLPDVPGLHERIGRFHEVVVPRYGPDDVLPDYGSRKRRKLTLPEDCLLRRRISVTQSMIDAVPIFQQGQYFVNDRFLEAVGDLLDKDFFVVTKIG